MQIALLLLIIVVIVSPMLLPFFLVRTWSGLIRCRIQFVIVSICVFVVLMMFSFLATDITLNAGVRYWYLNGRECDPVFYCELFDAAFSSPGLTSLIIYALLAILWVFGIRLARPQWMGFRDERVVSETPPD